MINTRILGMLCLAAFTGLAACGTPSGSGQNTSRNATGPQSVTPIQAAAYFEYICVDNAPDFRRAASRLAEPPYAQNQTTGTYYHERLNLSFKLIPIENGTLCSMVFASENDAKQLGLKLAGVTARVGEINFNASTSITTATGPANTLMTFFVMEQTDFYRVVLGQPK